MAQFTLTRDLYHGKGALEALKTLKGKKAFVVVGSGSMKKFGFLDKTVAYLKDAGMETELFEGVEPDPSVEAVMKGAKAMRKFGPDWIVFNHIRMMNKALDISLCIRDYESGIIGEREFLEKLPKTAANAVGDACTGSNPRKITPPEMERLLKARYYDTDVIF